MGACLDLNLTLRAWKPVTWLDRRLARHVPAPVGAIVSHVVDALAVRVIPVGAARQQLMLWEVTDVQTDRTVCG